MTGGAATGGRRRAGVLALGAVALLAGCVTGRRGALRAVVQGCTLDSRVTGSPWPCLAIDRARTFVVVPDPKRRSQVLWAPTARIAGIESPQLLAAGAPDAWSQAWAARRWLDRRTGRRLGDEQVGLAVNSRPGRTQDQLHIHIDCLRPSTRRAVDAAVGGVAERWGDLPTPLFRGRRYRARWLPADELPVRDPFRLLAEDPDVGGRLAEWTLVMVAAARPTGERGFVLLSHRADPADGDLGAGEELLDHRCAVLDRAPEAG